MTEFVCNICATELDTEQIQTETKYNIDIDVAYINCPECGNRFNLIFDNKETTKLKAKIKKVKEIEHYLQMQLYREMLIVEDKYYEAQYNQLPPEDKKRIGGYQSNVDKQKIKEYNAAIKSKEYGIKDLLKLL